MSDGKVNPTVEKALDDATLKQYKVSIMTIALHNFTVMAPNEKRAHDLVVQPEPGAPPAGRSAGSEGPVPFATRVRDMTIVEGKDVTLSTMMQEMMANMREQVKAELGQEAVQASPSGLVVASR